MQKCSICGKNYKGYGNNAQPINDGECCDKCNFTVVVPTRLVIAFGTRKPTKKETQGW